MTFFIEFCSGPGKSWCQIPPRLVSSFDFLNPGPGVGFLFRFYLLSPPQQIFSVAGVDSLFSASASSPGPPSHSTQSRSLPVSFPPPPPKVPLYTASRAAFPGFTPRLPSV